MRYAPFSLISIFPPGPLYRLRRALRRAGVEAPLGGAYVFRHTVASRLVRRGASLKEVADFLGYCCLDSAAIYAKLDLPTLREVALPWPEVIR